jgi:hypothetical protein
METQLMLRRHSSWILCEYGRQSLKSNVTSFVASRYYRQADWMFTIWLVGSDRESNRQNRAITDWYPIALAKKI